MKLFIHAAKLIDRSSPFHLQIIDIYIVNGKVEAIGQNLTRPENTPVYTADNLHVSVGWFDLRANFADPGYEHKETLQTGINAAAEGGFTGVALSPATAPVIDSKSLVEYIKNQANTSLVDVHPMGTVSKKMEGKELAELYDMRLSGALAFSDDKQSVQNPNLLKTALLYAKAFNGLIIQYPNQYDLSYKGMMHEGEVSTNLGMKGIPALAEEIMVNRDIYLVDYTESKIHFSTISTSGSVDLIKEAKKDQIAVTSDVCALNLLLEDKLLEEFDTRYKLLPPLRDKKHINALIKGLKNQTIDAICSDHQPEDIELKKREFEHAAFGCINLQTAFAAANTALKNHLEVTDLIEKFTVNPRKILGLPQPQISVGELANLTLFDPALPWEVEKKSILSKSKNSPLFGKTLIGKALGVINKNQTNIPKK
jgi:dihydroorotase